MQVEESERFLMSREDLEAKLAVLTAGRAAEEFVFGTCTTGAANDIEQATRLARLMVTRYGMSSRFGMVALDAQSAQYLDGDLQSACSPQTAAQVDEEIQSIISDAYQKAFSLLRENARALNTLANALLDAETMTGDTFMELLSSCEQSLISES